MELTPAQLANLQAITLTSSKARLGDLSVGQQLLAKVISASADGDITLNINNAILNARSTIPMKEGQLLQLLVAQTGKQIVLQLPQKLMQEAAMQQLTRESLPKQQPLHHAVQQLQQVVKQSKQLNLPPKITQAIQNFVNRLPDVKQLSNPASLREAVRNSGVFMEKSILQTLDGKVSHIKNDMKALLFQLRNVLAAEKANLPAQQTQQSGTQASTNRTATAPQSPAATAQNAAQTTPSIKPDSAKVLTTQTVLTSQTQQALQTQQNQPQPKQAQLNTQASKTGVAPQTSTPLIKPIAADTKAETALNIKTVQTNPNTSPLGRTNLLTAKVDNSLLAPTPQSPLTKPTMAMPTQYSSGRQAASIKEALALNPSATAPSSSEGGLVARFSNLVDLIEQLIRQVDSSVARTQLHQINTMQDQEAGRLAWSMEIPVKQEDETHLVQLEIEKENVNDDSEAVVTVNLAVDLEHLGPVYARITLMSNNVGVVFWAERQSTFELTLNNMDDLEDSLVKSGFDTPKINCHHGQPPQMRKSQFQLPDNLLDIKV